MKKSSKIALIATGTSVVLVGLGIYLLLKNRGKNKSLPSTQEPVPTPKENYEKTSAIKALRESIKKGNYTMEIICPRSGGVAVHCKTGGTYSPSLVQGVWIQLKRSVKDMNSKLKSQANTSGLRRYGEALIRRFDSSIDSKFDPAFYNQKTSWYKDYLSRGGIPI